MSEYIIGKVSKIIFESQTNSYKVGVFIIKETNAEELIDYKNKTISFTGSFNELTKEIEYIFYGQVVNHPKYGMQFNMNKRNLLI